MTMSTQHEKDTEIAAMAAYRRLGFYLADELSPEDVGEVIEAVKAAGYAVVKLPEAHHIRVSAINMHPECEDADDVFGPRVECRFTTSIPNPGRLFNRSELAAALLAADRDGGDQ